MPKPVLCDQCGRELTEEDFRTGGAFRDHADVLCADCLELYREDERRRDRDRKRRDSEAAIEARVQARAGRVDDVVRTGGRGATRAITAARRSGVRRKPKARSGLVVMFILAAAVAFTVAIVLVALMKEDAPGSRRTRPGPRANGAPSRFPTTPGPATRPGVAPAPAPDAVPATREKPEDEKRGFEKSLFGPGGQFGRRPEKR